MHMRIDAVISFQPTLPLRGATRDIHLRRVVEGRFNPRSPCGERRIPPGRSSPCPGFNPRSPCGERPGPLQRVQGGHRVSTHAPLAGSDKQHEGYDEVHARFNPRSPCGERRPFAARPGWAPCFNPRSPCGERPCGVEGNGGRCQFQPTLPLRGATRCRIPQQSCRRMFQPTLPLRGATGGACLFLL